MAPCHSLRARGVQPKRVALTDRLQIRADSVEVELRRTLPVRRFPRRLLARDQHHEHLTLLDRVTHRDLDPTHHPIDLRDDLVLHLHRFQHDQRHARAHPLSGQVLDRHL
jgi:hypothetical protein